MITIIQSMMSKSIGIVAITTAAILSLFATFNVIVNVSTVPYQIQHYQYQQHDGVRDIAAIEYTTEYTYNHNVQYMFNDSQLRNMDETYHPCKEIINVVKSDPTGGYSFLESTMVGWRDLFFIGKTDAYGNWKHRHGGKYIEYKQIEREVLVEYDYLVNPMEIFGNCNDPCWKPVAPKILNAAYFDSMIGKNPSTHYMLNNPKIVPNGARTGNVKNEKAENDNYEYQSFKMTFLEMKQLVVNNLIKNRDVITPLTKYEMEAFEWNFQTYLKTENDMASKTRNININVCDISP